MFFFENISTIVYKFRWHNFGLDVIVLQYSTIQYVEMEYSVSVSAPT